MARYRRLWALRIFMVLSLALAARAQFQQPGASPFAVGSAPAAVVVADFNNDLLPDLAIANTNSNNITVLLGNGAGAFLPAQNKPISIGPGTNPVALVAGDFNNDGNMDLVIADLNKNQLTLLLGLGTGSFMQPATAYTFPMQAYPSALAAADFNNDGNLDLLVTDKLNNTVTLLIGNGMLAPQFTPAGSPFPLGTGTSPASIAVGDFNQDGYLDAAIANLDAGTISVLLNNGKTSSPGFTQPPGSPYSVFETLTTPPIANPYPASIVTADFNKDGHLDLAIANEGTNDVAVLLGDTNDDGGFTQQAAGSPFAVGVEPVSLGSCSVKQVLGCDFNKDGNDDLAVVNYKSGTVTVLLGNGSLTNAPYGAQQFSPLAGSPFMTGSLPHSVAVGDFTADGKQDFAIANEGSNNVTVLLNGIYSATITSAAKGQAALPVRARINRFHIWHRTRRRGALRNQQPSARPVGTDQRDNQRQHPNAGSHAAVLRGPRPDQRANPGHGAPGPGYSYHHHAFWQPDGNRRHRRRRTRTFQRQSNRIRPG